MELEIIDLEEFSKNKEVKVKLGKYLINVNDVPLKIALKINAYYTSIKNSEETNTEAVIDDIVIPLIMKQNKDAKREDIIEDFNYDQIMKLFNLIFSSFFTAGSDAEKKKDKKKE